jgi:hypothetical protein
MHRELHGRDDTEVATTASQRPEQVRLVLGVGAQDLSIGRHQRDGGHCTCLQSVRAAQPPDAAAQRVADDAHVRRRAMQSRQAQIGQPRHHVPPPRRGPYPYPARVGIDRCPHQC